MSANQEKLNEQLFNVVADEKVSDEAKLKKVKYLVRLGADVNAKLYGKSVLSKAIENEVSVEVIEFLREKGAIEWVISKEEAKKLSQGFWDDEGDLKSLEEIKELIKKGADVNAQNKYGRTALMWASYRGNKEVVELLLANGADTNLIDKSGDTALIDASNTEHKEIVELLAQNGADVNVKNEDGGTALMLAAKNGQLDVVKYLIDNGADFEAKDKDGWTALSMAAIWGELDVVKCLVELGADVEAKDKNGWTALDHARMRGNADCVKFLEELQQKGEPKVEVLSGEEKNTTVKKRGMWQRIFGGRD